MQSSLGKDITARAGELESDATRTLVFFGLLALGSIAALAALAIGAARSVSGPLGALTRQARDVAGNRLPAAVARVQTESGAPEPLGPLAVPSTSSSWTTSPPVCAATPRACWCSPVRPARGPGPPRCR
ncbi:hypothetical protein OG422_05990 [Streptomyces sp. NBC_01525]|uniref:hypothetical protein n=1 Tax=Streptomyces sp. NBC_01525 TaxID=2903893 RepID=UPI003868D295